MKLRKRKTRGILGNVKQEDQKDGTALSNTSSSVVDRSPNTTSVTINQEDTKEDKPLLRQNTSDFGKVGYYYRCNICNKKMVDLKSVLEHRQSTHNVKHSEARKMKDIALDPDVHDPNFYCKSCEMTRIYIAKHATVLTQENTTTKIIVDLYME
ncbi:hypothetical protein MBANPS3_000078 [Mucor bainieri]